MLISLIAAMTNNRVIGKDNQMPWHLPADLRHFKQKTLGKPVVMGRKTYQSIGKPLPGRLNIVLSRNPRPEQQGQHENLKYVSTPEQAIALAENEAELMIIGGEAIYRLFLPLATRAYLTYIDTELEGDACFPELPGNWRQSEEHTRLADADNDYPLRFVQLDRQQ